MSRLYNLALFLFISSVCLGQELDSAVNHISFQDEITLTKKLEIRAEGGLITSFLNNSLVKNDHWNDEIISNQINSLNDLNRFGAYINASALYHNGTGLYFGGGYQTLIGASAEKPIVQAVLEGNQNQPIISLNKNSGFEQASFAFATVGKEFIDSTKHKQVRIGLGVYSRQTYNKITATSGDFALDSAGENVTVTGGDVSILQDLANPFSTLGLGINFEFKQVINDNLFSFSVENLGVFFSSNTRNAQMISDFNFDGFNLSSQINNAGSVSLQDSVNQKYFDTDTSNSTQLIPFTTKIGVTKPIGETNAVEAEVTYVYFTGYMPLLTASFHQRFKGKTASWNVGARVGGFGNYGLSLGAQLPINRLHRLTLNVSGLESMASQNLPVNWYAQMGLRVLL